MIRNYDFLNLNLYIFNINCFTIFVTLNILQSHIKSSSGSVKYKYPKRRGISIVRR